jgi:hypothetical protein
MISIRSLQRRTDFIEFQTKFLRSGETDAESLNKAIEEMNDLISEVQNAATKLPLHTIAQDVCQIVPIAATLGVALTSGVGIPLATTAAVCWFANLCVDEWFNKSGISRGHPLNDSQHKHLTPARTTTNRID